MRVRTWLGRIGLGLLLLIGLLVAYGYYATREQPQPTRSVRLRGDLVAAPGLSGTATVRVFQAWAGEGALRHPLEPLVQFTTPLGTFDKTIDYPANGGEGLVVYAWLDADGDGVHCTPMARNDPAGLAQVPDFPGDEVRVTVEMTQPCAGPEYFFPR
jgi:hypothetical protein